MNRTISLAVFAALSVPSLASAATWTVSPDGNISDFMSLQEAVDVAQDGDEIQLLPGNHGSADILGKDLLISGMGEPREVRLEALFVAGGANVTLDNVAITNGSQQQSSVAVAVDGPSVLRLEEVIFVYSTGRNMETPLLVVGSEATALMHHSLVAGIHLAVPLINVLGGHLVLDNSVLDNSSGGEDGVIYGNDARIDVMHSRLRDLHSDWLGGAIFMENGGELEISGSEFIFGGAAGVGGHLCLQEVDSLRVLDSQFHRGEAQYGGGSMALYNVPDVDIQRSVFINNTGGSQGGALWAIGENTNVHLTDVEMFKNSAERGGHMQVYGAMADLIRVVMEGGSANYGGALSSIDGMVSITNAAMAQNTGAGWGNAIYQVGGSLDASFVTLANNNTESGALITVMDGDAHFWASIISDNEGGQPLENLGKGLVDVADSIVMDPEGDYAGENVTLDQSVLSADPMFTMGLENIFLLRPGSPGLDAVVCDSLEADGTECDMGQYGGPAGWLLADDDADGFVVGRDCNDSDPAVNEAAEEIPGDGLDNDCNGFDGDEPMMPAPDGQPEGEPAS